VGHSCYRSGPYRYTCRWALDWNVGGHEDAAGPMLVNDGDTILTEKGFRDRVNERLEGGVGLWVDPRWAPDPKTE
jgi:hypothetical protein